MSDCWKQVADALLTMTCNQAELVCHATRPWHSATFSGTRHSVALSFSGAEALPYAEAFLSELPEHGFELRGHLLADAAVVSVERQAGLEPRTTICVDIVLLEHA